MLTYMHNEGERREGGRKQQIYNHTSIDIYIHTYIHAHTQTHTHTHTPSQRGRTGLLETHL